MALKVNVDSEGSNFFDQDVKGLGHTSVNDVIAFDNVFVDPGSTRDVVRLNGEHFLKRVRGTISLKRPDLHLTEALTTKLGLTTQRLLGYLLSMFLQEELTLD